MFDAQLLMAGTTVYSPWMARGGDALIATLEVVARSGAAITVDVFTKNSDATSGYDGGNAASGATYQISASAVGRFEKDWNPQITDGGVSIGIKEMVRYKFNVTGTAGQWVLFRMLAPVWYDNVDAV